MRIILSLGLIFSFNIALLAQEMPGGFVTIPPSIDYLSVANRADLTELLAVLPQTEPELQGEVQFRPDIWARDVRHVRDVWCLQFSFRPVRIIDVDIPNEFGTFDKKKVWYLLYNVKNLGPSDLDQNQINSILASEVLPGAEQTVPVPRDITVHDIPRSAIMNFRQQTGVFAPHPGRVERVRFVPQFVLATNRLVLETVAMDNPETGQPEWHSRTTAVAYTDRIIPLALARIKQRERMENLETTVSIAEKEIGQGEELWGVAMWMDVDPRINEFSIFVSGLTNAYQWSDRVDENGEFVNTGNIGEGRIIKRRVLQLDWWRVGDQGSLSESQIHFGSRNMEVAESVFTQTGRLTAAERERRDRAAEQADANADGWVSPAERAIFHLYRQDWLKPGFGYEWVFL
ncbi:MAG: hypothetical protein FWG73_00840 [Planctomycetaceae bacterium]|nr:hypothetical protein [Planctomycetaceae bacterium]